MLASKNPHDRDHQIQFFPENHIYDIDGDQTFISTTTLVHQYFPEFNALEVLRRMRLSKTWPSSPYFGKTDEEIMKQWEDKKNRAADLGTRLHAFIEDFYNESESTQSDLALRDIAKELLLFEGFVRDHSGGYNPYRTEWFVFDKTIKLAGSIDMVFHRPQDPPDTLCIYDWKRVASLKMRNPFQKALYPIGHLDDCNFHQYSLQLNIYKYILETCYGKKIVEMKLVLIHSENDAYKVVEVPCLTKEVKALIEARKEQLGIFSPRPPALRLLTKKV